MKIKSKEELLAAKYDPKIEEKNMQKFWDEEDIYAHDPLRDQSETYSIDTPPPTISGAMHMGHAFSYSQMDFYIRYQRMKGKNVFFPFGTDDNGLPTGVWVEKKKNVQARKIQRSEFVKLCFDTLKEYQPEFIQAWKNIGISSEFKQSYSTISPKSQEISQKSFIDLYHKGHVFESDAPVAWCTKCQTAIAQAEFESVDMNSHFNDIIFRVGGKELVIATTRPELLPSCVAVIAHPSDGRYKDLIGKHAKVPLFDFEVPIITDERADPEKGTGIVMCCTFGDKTDIEWWKDHKLPLKTSITPWGKMNDQAQKYEGMSIKEARKQIIQDLKEANLLLTQKNISHAVNVHERCGTELEFLKTKQWFIRTLDKKEELLEQGAKITWYPSFMKARYDHWVENLNWDWCISRQRYFGVPFPLWHCKKCSEVKLAEMSDLPIDPMDTEPKTPCNCGSKDFEAENSVMDTWATSSITPQVAQNWDKNTDTLKYYPMTVRPQSHDIIRTWAFYTILKNYLHTKEVPWKNIAITGFVLDPKGKKMSKSKGNVIDPNEIIEKYNADALRFAAGETKLGDDIPFQEKNVVAGKRFVNKIWNAAKFSVMNMGLEYVPRKVKITKQIDIWLLTKLQETIKQASDYFEKYEYSKAKAAGEKFFFQDFCDNYIEIVKGRLSEESDTSEDDKESGRYTLYLGIITSLKLMAPFCPHVTEKIYQLFFRENEGAKSIHLSEWPKIHEEYENKEAEDSGDIAIDIIAKIRKYRSENKLSFKEPIKNIEIKKEKEELIQEFLEDIKIASNSKNIDFGKEFKITI